MVRRVWFLGLWGVLGAPVVSSTVEWMARLHRRVNCSQGVTTNYHSNSNWRGATVLCHCDNEAVVAAVKSGYCRDPTLAHMLCCLFFLEAKYDASLSAIHVPGIENGAADSISRNNLPLFSDLLLQAHQNCKVLDNLVRHLI